MKIYSWNVNGIRAALKKGFMEWFDLTKPDILMLQETKVQPHQLELNLPGYYQYWHYAREKKGYSGTVVFTKLQPKNVSYGLDPGIDNEGRVITLEFDQFFLVNVYTPNAKRGLERLDYRYKQWDPAFLESMKILDSRKTVIFGGDLNVAHEEIDLANPATNHKNAGFTDQEREGFGNYLKAGFVDTFRIFTKEGGHYSWWSHFANSRSRNIGWRIDYFLVSNSLKEKVTSAQIHPAVMGSDHCPVSVEIIDS